ncbi:TPA: hypothetical protein OT246_005456 [Klebsiella pneumoniae]|nr:hypothetical protein [Klebsiella pneumoniae]HCT5935176.1 hypothetical protein [Klebsiella pneumoniae]
MIKKTLCSLLLAVLCGGMVGPAVSTENDHRYISIRNTDSSWVQGVCSLVFRLDNGGDGTFNNLTVSLQLTDKSGAVLEKGTLDVQPFGDSSATRSTLSATEFSCDAVENSANIVITDVEETSSDGSVHALPLSMFDPQYYQPLKMSVQKSG